MAVYSFTKEARLYFVYPSSATNPIAQYNYRVDISNINFSQTFTEESYTVKTLHHQNMYEGSVINKANPANFEFTTPLLKEKDYLRDDAPGQSALLDALRDVDTFDLYILTRQDVFSLTKCVITNATFIIERLRPLSLAISGQATRLKREADSSDYSYVVPGTYQERTDEDAGQGQVGYNYMTRTHLQTRYLIANLNNVSISEDTVSVQAEWQHDIQWTPYTTVNNALSAVDADTTMYPSDFTVNKSILSGTITRYITDDNNTNLLDWNDNCPLYIKVGEDLTDAFYGLEIDLPACSFTNRNQTGPVWVQSYDWRQVHYQAALLKEGVAIPWGGLVADSLNRLWRCVKNTGGLKEGVTDPGPVPSYYDDPADATGVNPGDFVLYKNVLYLKHDDWR